MTASPLTSAASNTPMQRWALRRSCILPASALSLDEARQLATALIEASDEGQRWIGANRALP